MTDLRKAAEMALETAEAIVNAKWQKWEELATPEEFERWAKSRATHMAQALRQALAQPEHEPFCYHDGRNIVEKEYADHSDVFPLYTRPQAREPLNLAIIRKWPDGFQGRLQHVWLDVVSFIPDVKLYDLQRVLAEYGFEMQVYEAAHGIGEKK